MIDASDLFDSTQSDHSSLLDGEGPAWEAIKRIAPHLKERLANVDGPLIKGQVDERANVGSEVYVAEGAIVEAFATIQGPAWIGTGTTVRAGAYLRNNVIVGDECTLGNSSEFKNCLLFNKCEVPHFNYVGDSILGYRAHLGAGVICSNVRLDRTSVKLSLNGDVIDTGLRKFGALVGDASEVGCNSVLTPGTILGRSCILYPCTHWKGVLGDKQIVKTRQGQEIAPLLDHS